MSHSSEVIEKRPEIRMLVHSRAGLFMAVSDEYKGLMVADKSIREVERRLPGAIRDHFTMLGYEVGIVTLENTEDYEDDGGFQGIPAIIAQASLLEKRAP